MVVRNRVGIGLSYCTAIFKQSMGARSQVGIGMSFARLHNLAESVPWNRFLGSLQV